MIGTAVKTLLEGRPLKILRQDYECTFNGGGVSGIPMCKDRVASTFGMEPDGNHKGQSTRPVTIQDQRNSN